MKNAIQIRIATRGSHLALAQAKYVEQLLNQWNYQTQIVIIKTTGDMNYSSFSEIAKKGDEVKGLFTKEIEEALLNHTADIAVHSLKDLPTKTPKELIVAALPQRLDYRDYWIFLKQKKIQNHFPYIDNQGKVGTSSFRRRSLLKFLYPDLNCIDLRGNVPTRIKKLFQKDGPDAILLSGGGLQRLQNQSDWIENEILNQIEIVPLDPEIFPPAPGQGTIAVQCRVSDKEIIEILKKIHDVSLDPVIKIERGLLSKLEGGCHLPLGIHAKYEEDIKLYKASVFLGKDYPYGEKNKDIYILRYHKNPDKLIEFLYDELIKKIPIIVFGKEDKNQLLREKFNNNHIKFYSIIKTIYYNDFIKNIKNQHNKLNHNHLTVYSIFSAEGIRSLKLKNHNFESQDIIYLNGEKSKEIFLQHFPYVSEHKIFLSKDGTAINIANQIKNQYKPDEVRIIAVSAKEGRQELFNILEPLGYVIEQWIVYETQKRFLEKTEIDSIPENAFLIFGSPSIFDAFYESFQNLKLDFQTLSKDWKIITLGKTTFEYILNKHIQVYGMAKEPDYEKIINELL